MWINGPFGSGKTTTARALRYEARRRGLVARIYDPELLGSLLQRTVPRGLRPADFREQASWVAGTRAALWVADQGVTIVPMCVADPGQLATLVRGLDARNFQLVAPNAVVAHRLRLRGRDAAWGLRHLEAWRPLPALGEAVDARRSPGAIAADILGRLHT